MKPRPPVHLQVKRGAGDPGAIIMFTLEKLDRLNRKISLGLEIIGLAAMIFLVFITTVDVIGAKLFVRPVSGALDAVMLSQLVAISFAAGITLIVGRHVEVEFLVMLFPKGVQMVVDLLVKLLCLAIFVILVWQLTSYAHHLQVRNEVTPTARIPLYPFAYGAALGCVPVCLVYISIIIHSFLRLIKK
jgi:TRAP-type C4-dicarboxylate transport system permease small subunit